jgi:hypothetical protein
VSFASSHRRIGTLLGAGVGGVAALVACSTPVPPDDLGSGSGADTQPNKTPPPSSPRNTTETKGADASAPEAAAACKTVAPNNRCGLVPQCGCGPNETCDVTNTASGATSCVTAGGATLGRPCVQSGDCLAGLTCAYGACRPYCETPRSKCNVGGTVLCVEVLGDDGKTPITNKNICTLQCDPREPTAVCGTNSCHWLEDYYKPESVSDCNRPGTMAPYSDKCASDDDCQPGFACMNHPKYGLECERWCRIGVAGDCPSTPAGLKCTDAFGTLAPVINGVKEGVCQ